MKISYIASLVLSVAPAALCMPFGGQALAGTNHPRADSTGPKVFAHYMLITRPSSGDYSADMKLAKAAGIDAFAVNYGGYNVDYKTQNGYLQQFYDAAAAAGMKGFLSIDTTSTPTLKVSEVVDLINKYNSHPAQLFVDGRPFLSSFEVKNNAAFNWKNEVFPQLAKPSMFVGGTLSNDATTAYGEAIGDGPFVWQRNDLTANQTNALDAQMSALKGSRKWMAPMAPWFFKRFPELNAVNNADEKVFVDRFTHLLTLNPQPDFIELVTWNDYGESTYFGPAAPPNTDFGAGVYYSSLDHSGFLKIAKPFIRAFKAGRSSVTVNPAEEEAFLFYRLQPAAINDASGMPLPAFANNMKNDIYAVGMFAAPATVTVKSGKTSADLQFQEGIHVWGVPWTFGTQGVSASRNGQVFGKVKTGPAISASVSKYQGNVVII